MKAVFSALVGQAERAGKTVGIVLAALLPVCAQATDDFWINTGTVDSPLQIDALNVVNSGFMFVFSDLPFETSNTRNFTNSGTMIGEVGWLLDNSPANSGLRKPADNVVNLNTGTIAGLDGGGFITTNGIGGGGISLFASYLFATASNIVNKGTMSVGGNGWLKLIGTNVNLSRGALEVTGINAHGSVNNFPLTNFIPDVAISDIWWGGTNGYVFNSGIVWDGATATAPRHQVQQGILGGFGNVSFSINPDVTDSYSNITSVVGVTLTNADGTTSSVLLPTNMVKQAVFISLSDPNEMSAQVSWFPSTIFNNPYRTACVQIALTQPDVISGGSTITTLYFYDTLASQTNRDLLQNSASTALPPFVSFRPANYLLSRIDDGRFAAGSTGTGQPDPGYFADTNFFPSLVVTGEYSGYRAFVDNLVTEPPPLASGTSSNFPGRVQVFADKLDLTKTRVRGEGQVMFKATHLLSSAGAAIDCQNLSYTLGSTNGNLNVTNMAQTQVTRLKGDLIAWSGFWTNQMVVVLTNNFSTNNGTGSNAVSAPLTNIVNVGMHALILDGSGLIIHLPVITWDLVTHSTNVVLSDNLAVVQTLMIDAQSFTVDGGLTLSNTTVTSYLGPSFNFALNDFIFTNAPNLLYLTNNGSFIVPSEAHFGDDRAFPYVDFVNTGNLIGGGVTVESDYIESDGVLSATVGPLDLFGNLGLFQTGQTTSGGDIDLYFNGLKFSGQQVAAVGALNLIVTNGLSDSGPGSGNTFRVQNGFNLFIKPGTGDLLGSTFQDSAPNFVEVDHVWAGDDRGASSSGFSDNVALGQLVLTARNVNPQQAPTFFFTGATGHNGLYVDLLDLSNLGSNYLDMVLIDPSLTIYYSAAKLGFTPPPNSAGVPQEPEEFLNGQFGGHLVWVSGFAGPNSSVDVIINGVTVSVNRALRFSKIIDSNGNGIPNFFDPFPFSSNPLVLSASFVQTNQPTPGSVAVSWKAEAKTSYQVEVTSDILHPDWQRLTQYSNTSSSSSTVTIWDTNAPAGSYRFYRVKTTQ